ncbi:hypothetical protein ACYULU_11105 [Breznakiellaceae bacterium SP9]
MSNSGKGGNNHSGNKNFKRREQSRRNTDPRYDKKQGLIVDRPKWSPPKIPSAPLPVLECIYCKNPIKDSSCAITDRTSGQPAHFDCMLERLRESETLEKGDCITYIGGGRFGVVHFSGQRDKPAFTIKKIYELEDKEHRAPWRVAIGESYAI